MNNDHSDFCEGDSGIVLRPILPYTVSMMETGEAKAGVTSDDVISELIKIAKDTSVSTADRIAAYDVMFKIVEGSYRIGEMTE